MRVFEVISVVVAVALAACGQAAAPSDAEAQPATQAAAPAESGVSAADKAAVLRALTVRADARGQVENDCGEKVTPKFVPAALGGAVGTAILFVMEGGPNTVSCYGDGPGLTLMKREGATFREIYSARGRSIIVLPRMTSGVHDFADGGPGFSFPVWAWNGTRYAATGRQISDAEASKGAIYLP